jgi:hypothetical protein
MAEIEVMSVTGFVVNTGKLTFVSFLQLITALRELAMTTTRISDTFKDFLFILKCFLG